MKILVIGSNGFLGNAITQAFINRNDQVWAIYNKSSENIPKQCQKINIKDIWDQHDDFDVVILTVGNHSLSNKDLIDVNVNLTQRISNHFKSSKLIFISSVSVYGKHTDSMRENSSFNQPSFYGLSKLAGEAIVLAHERYAIIRLTYLFGETMADNSFLPQILNNACQNGNITLFGEGKRLQDYLHVRDAAELCVLASMYSSNDVFLGATGYSYTNLEIAKKIKEYVPGLHINMVGQDNAPSFRFNPTETIKKLNWVPVHRLDETIKQMVKDK